MKTTENTVLITGGSAGIGFEIAETLSALGNKVIITGRNQERLNKALKELKDVTGFVCDVTKEEDVDELVKILENEYAGLNMLINNAGQAFYNTLGSEGAAGKASEEMQTNYLSIVRLNEKVLPLLRANRNSAIVNVSSIVAFVPRHTMATYAASKAALHSYTQSLRIQLAKTDGIRVFELMPPLVNTDFSQEIGGANGISPVAVAEALVAAMEADNFEIHVGQTADIYHLTLASPADALMAMNS
jgi:uncharacterized oxidoreductase